MFLREKAYCANLNSLLVGIYVGPHTRALICESFNQIDLVGYSMGGAVAANFAVDHTCIHRCTLARAHIHTHMHACMYTLDMHEYVHACMYIRTYSTCMHACIYTLDMH